MNAITTDARGANVVFAADLDGDGDADVLSASYSDDKIAWYENLGDGEFSDQRVITRDADFARSVTAADLDGDGDLDVLSASHHDDKVAWYENLGNGVFSSQRVISSDFDNSRRVDAADVDGDGDIDVLAAGRELGWFENLGNGDSWERRTISTDVGNRAWTVRAADLDGDGDVDVVNASEPNMIAWYRNNGSGGFSAQIVITTEVLAAVGLDTADLDRDGDIDVLSASYDDDKIAWYENLGGGTFGDQRVLTTRANGANTIYAADLDGDGDLDVLSASEVDDKVAWYENLCGGEFSEQRVITTAANGAWSVGATDLDGDGDLDVLSASEYDHTIAWYENRSPEGTTFAECVVSSDVEEALSVHAADLDGDGDLDIASASSADDKIAWYANQAGAFPIQHVVSTDAVDAVAVYAADLDADGDADLVSATSGRVAWFQNDGDGRFAEETLIGAVSGPRSIRAADLDGDNDADLLSTSEGRVGVGWHENLGSGFAARAEISADVRIATAVDAADLDGDGDLDVLSASHNDDKIAWYENTGSGFSGQVVITEGADGADDVHSADLDADGDLDVLSASRNDDKIAWYENLNGAGFSEQRVIASDVDSARAVSAADLDADGDLDVVSAGYGESPQSGTVAWFENVGGGVFEERSVFEAYGAVDVHAADLDDDGDQDILAALGYGGDKVVVYWNLTYRGTSPQAAPADIAAVAAVRSMDVTWSAIPASATGGSPVTRYVVAASPRIGGEESTCEAPPEELRCTIAGLEPGVAYTLTVRAENARGPGPASAGIVVRLLPQPRSWRFIAEGTHDGAGFSVARSADRDGDGNSDVLIGAPFHSLDGRARGGAVYLIGSADLVSADQADGTEDGGIYLHNVAGQAESWKLVGENVGDNAGWSVAASGDVDDDGKTDLAIGAPTASAVYLVAIADLADADAADGEADHLIDLANMAAQANSWKIVGASGDGLGSGVVPGGDIDGDGRNEILLHTRSERYGASDIGAYYAISLPDLAAADSADGTEDGVVRTRHLPAQVGSWRFVGGNLSLPVGGAAADVGDADGDGLADLLVGASQSSPSGRFASGSAFLAASANLAAADGAGTARDGTVHMDDLATLAESWQFIGENVFDEAGDSVSTAGDTNDDGRSDTIVGAPGHSHAGEFHGGAAYLISSASLPSADSADGDADGIVDLASVSPQADSYKFVGDNPLDRAGVSLSSAGDPDGDGVADLLIGAQGGAAWLIAVSDLPGADAADGSADGVVELRNVAGQAHSWKLSLGTGRLFPTTSSLSAAGDVDGDGRPDLLAGVSPGGGNSGGVYLVTARDLARADAADGTADSVLHLGNIGPSMPPLPSLTIEIVEAPADVREGSGELGASVRWRLRSPWQAYPGMGFSIAADDERIGIGSVEGTAAVGDVIETSLEVDCVAPARFVATVTIASGEATASVPWTVHCGSGNVADMIVELQQGPMSWVWNSVARDVTTHVDPVTGRRGALVARVATDSESDPALVVTVRDDEDAVVSDGLPLLVDALSAGPEESNTGLFETTYVLDLTGEMHAPGHETSFAVELDGSDGDPRRVTYEVALSGWGPPVFDITFIPISSPAGTPPAIDTAAYMTGILDLFPIADNYVARVDTVHAYDGGSWDAHDAALELLHRWNEEAEGHEYYHGIFKYPRDGSTCGYAWRGRPVAISAALDDGCTPNIYAHELGHNFDLPHAPGGCGAADPDPDYPYARAGIGPRRGWLFSADRFVNPDDGYFDTMSYCKPNFISDYNYRKVVEFRRNEADVSDDSEALATSAGVHVPTVLQRRTQTTTDLASPLSLALTGTIDADGTWSLDRASYSARMPRRPSRGAFILDLLDRNAGIVHSESLSVHENSAEDGAAWAARIPIPPSAVGWIIVRDAKGPVFEVRLEEAIGPRPPAP